MENLISSLSHEKKTNNSLEFENDEGLNFEIHDGCLLVLDLFNNRTVLNITLDILLRYLEAKKKIFVVLVDYDSECFFSNRLKQGDFLLNRAKVRAALESIGFPAEHVFYMKKLIKYPNFSDAYSSLDDLAKFSYEGLNIGFGVASSLLSNFENHMPDVHKYEKSIRRLLKASYGTFKCIENLIQTPDLNLKMIIVHGGLLAAQHATLLACKKWKIPFSIQTVAGTNNRYILLANSMPNYDFCSHKNRIKEYWENAQPIIRKNFAEKWFNDRRKKIFQRAKVYIADQIVGKLPEGWDSKKRNFVLFTSAWVEIILLEDRKLSIHKDECELLADVASLCQKIEDVHLYIRIHPHLKGHDNAQMKALRDLWKTQRSEQCTFIWPEEDIDSYALIDNAEKVIVYASTIGLEANYWGKPVILLGHAEYEDLDCAYFVHNKQELSTLMAAKLTPKPRENSLPYGYFEETYGIPFKFKEKYHKIVLKPKYTWKEFFLYPKIVGKYKLNLLRHRLKLRKIFNEIFSFLKS